MKLSPSLVFTLFLSAQLASAQSTEKTLYFVHLTQDLPEAANAIRTIAGVAQPALDEAKRSLTLSGTPDQLALGEWLFKSLDVASNGPADPNVGAPYRVSGTDDIVRIFYLTYTDTVQQAQEVATAIRTVGEVRLVWVYAPQKAFIVRGTPEQLAMTEWVSSALDRHKKGLFSPSSDFKLAADKENVVRVLWAATPPGMREFQNMATALRTLTDIRRVFTYNDQKAIVLRGNFDQIEMASWLLKELDQPAHETAPHVLADTTAKENILRVFYLNPKLVGSESELQKVTTDFRSAGNLRLVFTYPPTLAIGVRGAENQIAAAEKTLEGKLRFSASSAPGQ